MINLHQVSKKFGTKTDTHKINLHQVLRIKIIKISYLNILIAIILTFMILFNSWLPWWGNALGVLVLLVAVLVHYRLQKM